MYLPRSGTFTGGDIILPNPVCCGQSLAMDLSGRWSVQRVPSFIGFRPGRFSNARQREAGFGLTGSYLPGSPEESVALPRAAEPFEKSKHGCL